MTDQITVPRETWDAMREALESVGKAIPAGQSTVKTCYAINNMHRDAVQAALTAANAVSHPKPETAPVTEGLAITSESVLALLVKEMRYIATITNGQAHRIAMMTLEKVAAANAVSDQDLPVGKCGVLSKSEPQAQGEARSLMLAKQQWESWKKYALELQERLVKYEGGAPMVLNATHPQATEPAWRPIETAPKDGGKILVCKAKDVDGNPMGDSFGLFVQRAAWWEGEGWVVYCSLVHEPQCFFEPTHWMPLPAAPEAKQ